MKPQEWKNRLALADWSPLALLGIMIWAPFIARAAAGRSALADPLMHDIGLQWVPFRMFIARALAAGHFPLWSPQVYAGFPFAAFSHTGVFYPPGWVLLLGDHARAVNFFYPLHITIAAFGAYALGKRLGLTRLAAWFAAFTYGFTIKPFYFVHFLPAACSNPWVPWFLFAALSLLRTGALIHALLAAAFVALQVLGGDVESTSYGLLFSGLFLALIAPSQGIKWRRFPLLLFPFAAAGLMCAVQALPLLELSRHFVRNHGVTFAYFSQRRLSPGLLFAMFAPLKGAAINEAEILEAPYFYMGAVTLALAITAAVRRLYPGSRTMGLLTLASALWAFGSIGLIDRIQYALPVLGSFGSPEHAFFIGELFLCLLAGQAVMALQRGSPGNTLRLLATAALAAAVFRIGIGFAGVKLLASPWFLLAAAAAGIGYGLWNQLRTASPARRPWALPAAVIAFQVIDLYSLAFIYLPSTDPKAPGYPPRLASLAAQVRALNARYIMISREWLVDRDLLYHAGIGLDMDAVDGWITVPPRNYVEVLDLIDDRAVTFADGKLDQLGFVGMRDGRFIDAATMPLIDLLSLSFFIVRELPLKFSTPFVLFESPADVHKRMTAPGVPSLFLQDEQDSRTAETGRRVSPYEMLSYRLFINSRDRLQAPPPSLVSEAGRSGACDYSVRVRGGDTAAPLIEDRIAAGTAPAPGPARELPLEAWAGKTVDLSFEFTCPVGRPDLKLFWDSPRIVNDSRPLVREPFEVSPRVRVYRNREALPRAFVVHEARVAADSGERLKLLKAADRDLLSREVLLERDPAGWLSGPAASAFGQRDAARQVSRGPGEEIFEVSSRGPGLLFVSNQYYPGWRALVAGAEVPIFRADHCFRAVPVPDGKSVVRMVFTPLSFRVGLWMTLVGAVCAAAVVARRGIIR